MMMALSPISNPESSSTPTPQSSRKRRRRIRTDNPIEDQTIDGIRWKTESEQRTYSSKLIEALSQVRRNSTAPTTLRARVRAVRETSDRVLAVVAKGRTRWSRAILRSRLRLRINITKRRKAKKVNMIGRLRKSAAKKTLPPMQRKAKVLRRLVPGCRKVSFPNLLKEATDYIAALEMQVRALSALTGVVASAGRSLDAPSDRSG
ncbi:hypothetical protein LguiB_006390 [Lonicera macranthoides]